MKSHVYSNKLTSFQVQIVLYYFTTHTFFVHLIMIVSHQLLLLLWTKEEWHGESDGGSDTERIAVNYLEVTSRVITLQLRGRKESSLKKCVLTDDKEWKNTFLCSCSSTTFSTRLIPYKISRSLSLDSWFCCHTSRSTRMTSSRVAVTDSESTSLVLSLI